METQVIRGAGKLWVPIKGSVAIQPSTEIGSRFAGMRMTFSGNYFAVNDGYEQDLKLNNQSGIYPLGTYLSTAVKGTTLRAIPKAEE